MPFGKNHEDFGESRDPQNSAALSGEDSLEKLLDSQSDEEFGEAVIVEHLDANAEPLILKNWTAQDFADIYVRFYPHVLRQAKRYLTNHAQAEEMTQDAFLYLMTSLPEVDSEVGVLKLLKWKTRLLALDLIKANSGAKFTPIDDQLELSTSDSELSLQLERADDAAIVAMALAKLEPRQREALVATLYEEKSTAVVADQLGINENATRQLVFRAKAAFKRALVGEAETHGLSLAEILSVAARKASHDAGKYVSVASALLLAVAISVGVLPNLGGTSQQIAAQAPASGEAVTETSQPSQAIEDPAEAVSEGQIQQSEVAAVETAPVPAAVSPSSNSDAELDSVQEPMQQTTGNINPAVQLVSFSDAVDYSPFDPWLLDPLVSKDSIQGELLSKDSIVRSDAPSLVTVVSNDGIWADVIFQSATGDPFQSVKMGISIDGSQYFANVSKTDLLVLAQDEQMETYVLVGSIGAITDVNGNSYRQTRLDGATVRLSLEVNVVTGKIGQTSFALTGRS